jgi:Flp pilus assembly protein TadG
MIRLPFHRGGRRRAATAVEFAIVAPVFFLVLLGIIEYARFLFTLEMLNNAAREGARYAAVNTTAVSTSDIQTYVDKYLAGQGSHALSGYSPTSSITVYKADPTTGTNQGQTWVNAGWGDGVGVTISGTYRPILPGLARLASSFTIKGTCVMVCEAN